MTKITAQYDAIMLCSYGGPRKEADVLPFMRNATHGRGVPDQRLLQVSGHYGLFNNISPINARNAELKEALERTLRQRGEEIEVVIGNRNWTPFFHDTLCDLAMRGKTRILCVFTSAYVCYSGCRQYREDLAKAQAELSAQGLEVTLDKIRPYYTTEGFIQANTDRIWTALAQFCPGLAAETALAAEGKQQLGEDEDEGHANLSEDAAQAVELPRLAFVTHSIPQAMEDCSGPADGSRPRYSQQHLDVCQEIVRRLEARLGVEIAWDLSYCSRSGPLQMPWLEPDINDRLAEYQQQGVKSVIAAPIGFICDHMEVVFDLDTEAKQTAADLGLTYLRADTVGTHPQFVQALADLIAERASNLEPNLSEEPGLSGESDPNGADGPGPVRPGQDALSPHWPACPPPGDSLVSPQGEKLPVVCEDN